MNMWKEFRDFIAKGNVIDMAIGVVMGTAFTAIVNAIVKDLIMPIVAMATGSIDFSDWVVEVGSARILIGDFINTVISFFIIAFILFFIMKAMASLRTKMSRDEAEEEAPTIITEEVQLLTEIRDLLSNNKTK